MNKSELKLTLKRLSLDFKDSAGKLTKNAVDSSKKITEKVKIQGKIAKAEKKRKDAYIAIGRKYQELYGNQADTEFVPYLEELADAEAIIAAARAELAALDTATICANCGKYVAESQNFCPYCGMKVQNDPIEAEAEVVSSKENSTVPEETPVESTEEPASEATN